jgi:uncharacterized BrkB/YihY/UPF0761 family membrane protein
MRLSEAPPRATSTQPRPLILTILGLVFAALPTLMITLFAVLPAETCSETIDAGVSVTRCASKYTMANAEILLLPISFILLASGLLYGWKRWRIARWSLLAGAVLCIVVAVGGTAKGGAYFTYFGFLELAAGLTGGAAALRRN